MLLARHELPLGSVAFDTLLAGYLLDPSQSHDLEALAASDGVALARVETLTRRKRGQQLSLDELTVEEGRDFAGPRVPAVRASPRTI